MASANRGEHGAAAGDSGRAHLLPVDTDAEDPGSRLFRAPPQAGVVAAVFAGGLVGGLTRYEVVKAWTGPHTAFPWSTFVVNTAGVFVLALLVIVVAEVLAPTTYLRPLVGTGFCGALTTFSAVTVQVDELGAHGHVGTAVGYLAASLAAGLAAAAGAVWVGRRLRPAPARAAHRGSRP